MKKIQRERELLDMLGHGFNTLHIKLNRIDSCELAVFHHCTVRKTIKKRKGLLGAALCRWISSI